MAVAIRDADVTAAEHQEEGRKRPLRRVLAGAAAGAAAAILAVSLLSTSGDVGPTRVSVRLRPALEGKTEIAVPPLGGLDLDTHGTPLTVRARIDQIDVEAVRQLARAGDIDAQLRSDVERDVRTLAGAVARRALLVAVVAGIVAGALIPGRRRHTALAGGLSAAILVSGTLAWTWTGLRPDAVNTPRFTGALTAAPELLSAVRREVGDLDGVRERVDVLADRIALLDDGFGAAPVDDEVRLLHISDVHLNPIGLELAASLAAAFDVDAVIDTGDLTSFGVDAEARIAVLLDQFPVPYYLVPGNHDSPANRDAMARHPNVTLVDGQAFDVAGLTVLGVGDPGFTALGGIPYDEAKQMRRERAGEVVGLVDVARPDVLAVAGAGLAEQVLGDVPLVISGDIHRRSEDLRDGTRLLTVGSTGATGLGSFTVVEDRPYEAQVLRFADGRLTGLDYVSLSGLSGAFTFERVVYPVATGRR
jgi:Calcineurin-like phosphoesterase